MVQASKVLGKLTKPGSSSWTLRSEPSSRNPGTIAQITQGEGFFDFEVDRALEMMRGGGQEIGRYAAVLILYQLADKAPAVFMRCVVSVLDMIWTPLKDHRVSFARLLNAYDVGRNSLRLHLFRLWSESGLRCC